MKLKCLVYYFKEALSLIEKISSKNTTLPILNSVLLSSKKKEFKAITTNLEVGLKIEIPAKVEKEGEVAIPTKLLYGFLLNMPSNENIELKTDQNNLTLTTQNSSTIIKGYQVDDFPLLPIMKEKSESFNLPIKDFLLALNSVYYAASSSEIKPEIASVFIYSQRNTPLTFVATDSFRLARKVIPYSFATPLSLLIPIKSVVEIMRIFENESGDIKIAPNKNQLFIFSERIQFICRLTEGVFPDYEEIIPKTFSTDTTINKTLFNNSLKIASAFSGKLNEVKLEVIPENKEIKIQTRNSDFGEHTASLPAEINGENLKITFNYRYLNDSLRFISSDKALLRFNGDNKPLFVTDSKDSSFYCLVMPMKDI